jgi:hypothetical protein
MEIITKIPKWRYTNKHIYLGKIHKEEETTLEKLREKRWNYVQTQ